MPRRQIRTSSLVSVTLINVATLLPAKLVHIGTIVGALLAIIFTCICYRLPHQALPRLTKRITEVESIMTLLDDTRFALDARLTVKTLKIELGFWEVEYLGLSALPWTSYPSWLWYVVRGVDIATSKARSLFNSVKAQIALESKRNNSGTMQSAGSRDSIIINNTKS
ncbi:hypothetical protein C8J56DRAFT_931955, partial [Mycena floridula]